MQRDNDDFIQGKNGEVFLPNEKIRGIKEVPVKDVIVSFFNENYGPAGGVSVVGKDGEEYGENIDTVKDAVEFLKNGTYKFDIANDTSYDIRFTFGKDTNLFYSKEFYKENESFECKFADLVDKRKDIAFVAKIDKNGLMDVLDFAVGSLEPKVEIGKVKLDFNNDEMMYGVQCTLKNSEDKIVYQTYTGELDDFEIKDENRNYDVFQNNPMRCLLGLSSNCEYYRQPMEAKNTKLSKDCNVEVSFTNLFGSNADVNSVEFPLKEIADKEITNDMLAKKFPKVFTEDLRMVVEFVNEQSASYLKPLVERYNLDNSKNLEKENDKSNAKSLKKKSVKVISKDNENER